MAMNLKKITRTLSRIRKNVRETGDITPEDEDILRDMLGAQLAEFFENDNDNDNNSQTMVEMPELSADNDNAVLNRDQKYRLGLIEKSDSGSYAIH